MPSIFATVTTRVDGTRTQSTTACLDMPHAFPICACSPRSLLIRAMIGSVACSTIIESLFTVARTLSPGIGGCQVTPSGCGFSKIPSGTRKIQYYQGPFSRKGTLSFWSGNAILGLGQGLFPAVHSPPRTPHLTAPAVGKSIKIPAPERFEADVAS